MHPLLPGFRSICVDVKRLLGLEMEEVVKEIKYSYLWKSQVMGGKLKDVRQPLMKCLKVKE